MKRVRHRRGQLAFGAIFLLVFLAFCVTGLLLLRRYRQEEQATTFYTALSPKTIEQVLPAPTPSPGCTPEPVPLPEGCTRVAALQEAYPDVVGWVEIPDTGLSYPVVQGTDNSYYLDKLPDGTSNEVGSIFLDCRCTLSEGDLILYGHNVHRGTMFGSLRRYRDASYLEAHPTISFYTATQAYVAEIFSVRDADAYDTTVYTPDPASSPRVLTLSTCTGTSRETRLIVQAYLQEGAATK